MNDALQALKDIKPPVEVPDHSLWLLLALLFLLVALITGTAWIIKRKSRRRRRYRPDPKEVARVKLKGIDFNDAKSAVYTFDEYLPILIADDLQAMDMFEALQPDLERYKYKKSVPPLDRRTVKRMRELIRKGLR